MVFILLYIDPMGYFPTCFTKDQPNVVHIPGIDPFGTMYVTIWHPMVHCDSLWEYIEGLVAAGVPKTGLFFIEKGVGEGDN